MYVKYIYMYMYSVRLKVNVDVDCYTIVILTCNVKFPCINTCTDVEWNLLIKDHLKCGLLT